MSTISLLKADSIYSWERLSANFRRMKFELFVNFRYTSELLIFSKSNTSSPNSLPKTTQTFQGIQNVPLKQNWGFSRFSSKRKRLKPVFRSFLLLLLHDKVDESRGSESDSSIANNVINSLRSSQIASASLFIVSLSYISIYKWKKFNHYLVFLAWTYLGVNSASK